MRKRALITVGMVACLVVWANGASAATITYSTLLGFHDVWGSGSPNTSRTSTIPYSVGFTTVFDEYATGWNAAGVGLNWSTEEDRPALMALDWTGENSLALTIRNTNENTWLFQLHFNVGWTDHPYNEINYYVENTWTPIEQDQIATIVIDFSNAHVWQNGTDLGWINISGLNVNLAHITGVGIQVGADLPLGTPPEYDRTAEYLLTPIPEPGALALLGAGLCTLAFLRLRKR